MLNPSDFFAGPSIFYNFAAMKEKKTIRVDVCVIDPYVNNQQFVVPRSEYSYLPDSLCQEEITALTIRNFPVINTIYPTHFEIDVPVPCVLNIDTLKRAFQNEIYARVEENKRIDRENRMNMREPYEKYCEEKERSGRQPERLKYIKSWDLSKYGYSERQHVSVPYGEIVSWSVVQEYK